MIVNKQQSRQDKYNQDQLGLKGRSIVTLGGNGRCLATVMLSLPEFEPETAAWK